MPRATQVDDPPPEPEYHNIYQPYDGPEIRRVPDPRRPGETMPEPKTITQRVDDMARLDMNEAEDMMLSQLQQFLLTKTPPDVIMQRMNISAQSLKWLREKLCRKIKDQVRTSDPFDFIAPMIAEMDEAKAAAWREVALAKPDEWSRRLQAIRMALTANSEMVKILQLSGVFDNAPLRAPLTSDDEEGSANALKELAQKFLQGAYGERTAD